MLRHIKIYKLFDFYISISRKKPFGKDVVYVDRTEDSSKQTVEQMERNLDRVNMWIGNCDQKASFLLAVVGIVLTIIFTSGIVESIKTILIEPFQEYCNSGIGEFSFFRFLIAILLILGSVSLFVAVLALLLSLNAKTDFNKLKSENPGLEGKSLLFYKTISGMSYSDFSQATNELYNDYRSQVYINSVICSNKFERYKMGLKFTIAASILLAPAFIMLLFA